MHCVGKLVVFDGGMTDNGWMVDFEGGYSVLI